MYVNNRQEQAIMSFPCLLFFYRLFPKIDSDVEIWYNAK